MGHLVVVRGGRRGWEWYPHKGTEGIRFDPQREELIFSLNYSSDLKIKTSFH